MTVLVPTSADRVDDADVSFSFALTNPTGGAQVGTQAAAAVVVSDDDAGGVLRFSAASYGRSEGLPTATITVVRSGGSAGPVTVPYATTGGTASPGADYDPASGTLTFGPGQTSRTFTVTLLADAADEADETVGLSLGAPTGGATLGAPAAATLTLADDDLGAGVIQLGAATLRRAENAASAVFTVRRTGGTAAGASVAYATSDGSASAGSDYTSTSGTITFAAGQVSATVSIPLTNDTRDESDETVLLTLSSPGGSAFLGTPASAVLTITDNDVAGTIRLASAAASGGETGGLVTVTLLRTGGAASEATVAYATSNGSAAAGTDYSPAAGTVVFGPGETSRTISVTVLPDALAEPSETLTFTLTSPGGGAVLGSPSSAVLFVVDDDD
jgi:hypothetical protein